MSALTKAMSPWEHELSQMLGKSSHLIAAPETAWSTLAAIGLIVETLEGAAESVDEDIVNAAAEVGRQLMEWDDEIAWQFYELTEMGWTA